MSSSTGRPNVMAVFRDHDKLSALNETDKSSNIVTKTDKKLLETAAIQSVPPFKEYHISTQGVCCNIGR